MAIPKETVEQILQAARIEEVVGEFVTLKKRGANLIGVCPFHVSLPQRKNAFVQRESCPQHFQMLWLR